MVGRDVYEFVAVTTNDWRYAAVLWAEDIYRVRRMREGCQTLGGLQKLGFRKKVEWPVIDSELHGGVPFHALLSRQAFILAQVNTGASPNQRLSAEDRRGTQCFAHIVRRLGINQYYRRRIHCFPLCLCGEFSSDLQDHRHYQRTLLRVLGNVALQVCPNLLFDYAIIGALFLAGLSQSFHHNLPDFLHEPVFTSGASARHDFGRNFNFAGELVDRDNWQDKTVF